MKPPCEAGGGFWKPPWCRSSTIVSTPRCFRIGTSALTVFASSRKSSPATPDGVTTSGVPSSVSPMNAIFSFVDVVLIWYAGRSGFPVLLSITFAARYWKTEP